MFIFNTASPPSVCVSNNLTLVSSLRIGWFIKPFTHQTICQRRQPLRRLVEVYSRSLTNIWCQCRDWVVGPPCLIPLVNLCLSLTAISLIAMAYSRLSEFCYTLILHLLLLCVFNSLTLVAALRIRWLIKSFTHQTICQRRQPFSSFVEVCSRSPTNIWCHCLIVVFDPCASVPFVKLFLSLTAFLLITLAYFVWVNYVPP